MSNKAFQEYATSVAFSLTLSKLQCHALLRLWKQPREEALLHLQVYTLSGLDSRGLVSWQRRENGLAYGFNGLTDEGRLVCELLERAGLTIENTTTASIARSVARSKP